MITQEQLNALVKVEVYKILADMGYLKDQISASECWKLCGRRRFEALVKQGKITAMNVEGYLKPKYSRTQVLQAINDKELRFKKTIL